MNYLVKSGGTIGLLVFVTFLSLSVSQEERQPTKEQARTMEKKTEDKNHTLDDFSFLKAGISYSEILKRVGPPDEDVGHGVWLYRYRLRDGSNLLLGFISRENLNSARLLRPDGTEKWIIEPPTKK